MSNRLIHEKSPYLLQHAENPVDWYPWGTEALEKARLENKPILVSIGYSTCHWCHVMEHESYENREIAALMNRYLVNIKVDREERPDIDKIYMTAVSAMTGSGGWPLNVFITPGLKPFFGGTYFPPVSRWGHAAWSDVVRHIGESWQNPEEQKKMLEAGDKIISALKQYTATAPVPEAGDASWLDGGFQGLQEVYDAERGGFARTPKFPMPVYHYFLLRYYARTHEAKALEMCVHTLEEMARGGIYDHLGGGFARYSTDPNWHVPHFEKMLYDNAQLAVNYLEAYQLTRNDALAQVARETLRYLRRDMTDPRGGFYSAEDADSLPAEGAKEKREGAFYVWEKKEIVAALEEPAAAVFCFRYGVRDQGNVTHDPQGEFVHQNILYIAHPLAETARQFNLSPEAAAGLLEESLRKLLERRAQRPRPHLDDKILSSWNGLAISAFAKGYQVLGEKDYLTAAQRAAAFLKSELYDETSRTLYHRWRGGERRITGLADDYVFVIQGLLDLYESDFDAQWLIWARDLMESALQRFYDPAHGGFFMTAADAGQELPLRVKEDQDNVEPAASSVGAMNLLRLALYTDREDFRQAAEKTLRGFGTLVKHHPLAMPQMLAALDFALTEPREIVLAAVSGNGELDAMLKPLWSRFMPVKVVARVSKEGVPAADFKMGAGMRAVNNQPTAYVCLRHTCKEPTNDPVVLEKLLNELR